MIEFKFQDFVVVFEDTIKYLTFNNLPDYYGIVFIFNTDKIELLHNINMGYRILISNSEFSSKDVPFSKLTEHLLPPKIKIIWNE